MQTSHFGSRFAALLLVVFLATALSGSPRPALLAQDLFGGQGNNDPFGGAESSRGDDPFGAPAGFDTRSPTPKDQAAAGDAKRGDKVPIDHLYVWADDSPARQRIEAALDSPLTKVGFDFTEAPLEEVVAFLRDEYQIEIQVDVSALDELGIGPDEPISVNFRNVSLRSALQRMLETKDLTYVIADQFLLVTTEEEAETRLSVAVYPVGDLVIDGDFDSLIDALISIVAAETWAENGGGDSEIRPLEPGLLVISQTQAVHAEIVKTLTAIRRARQSPAAQAASSDKGSVKTKAYAVRRSNVEEHEKKVQQTADLLRRVVPLRPALRSSEAEVSEPQFITVVGEQLLVRATPAVHRQVKTFLADAELDSKGGAFCGGGGGGGGQFSAPTTAK